MSHSFAPQHPVLAAVSTMDDALAGAADADPIYMSTDDKAAALLRLSALSDQTEELRLRVLASADDVAEREGARDAAAWLAHHGRRDRDECRRRLRLARDLEKRSTVASALRAGAVNVAQAEVIVRAVQELPAEVGEEIRAEAEEQLAIEAQKFGPRELRVLGRRVLEVVASEVSHDLEARLLEQEEAKARKRTFLRTRRNGDGTTDIHLRVADAACDRLLTYLHAFTAPRRQRESAPDDRRPYDTHPRSARPSAYDSGRVAPRAATSPPPGARCTTAATPGPGAGRPTWLTGTCSARSTTIAPTTIATPRAARGRGSPLPSADVGRLSFGSLLARHRSPSGRRRASSSG